MAKKNVTFGIEGTLDKSNVIKSSSFHMDQGDILHIIYKDHSGATVTIALVDSEGEVEVVQVIPTTTPAPTTTLATTTPTTTFTTTTTPEPGSDVLYGALYNWYAVSETEDGDVEYGYLYNWYAVDTGMLAASGWRIPTDTDTVTLMLYLDPAGNGGTNTAGGSLKEDGLSYWLTPNTGADNSMNFYGRGAGYRHAIDGTYKFLQSILVGWTSVEMVGVPANAYIFSLSYNSDTLNVNYTTSQNNTIKETGSSVRLVRDATVAEQLLADGTACDDYIGTDLKVYPTVKIGTQVWMASNLAETLYNDLSAIPNVTDNATWVGLTSGARCGYNNDEANALAQISKLAPIGWHIPTKTECETLMTTLGGASVSGGHLKETGIIYWNDPNVDADNSSGFSARGAGDRTIDGIYEGLLDTMAIWTSSVDLSTNPYYWICAMSYDGGSDAVTATPIKIYGLSIRAIKDDSVDPGYVVDYDGNVYSTITIGSQVWMAENLAVTHYNDGTAISDITDDATWNSIATAAYCWYDNNAGYGLYTTTLAPTTTVVTTTTIAPLYMLITTNKIGEFTISLDGSGDISIVDWGDGVMTNYTLGGGMVDLNHTFTSAPHTVIIYGAENITHITCSDQNVTGINMPSGMVNIVYIELQNNDINTFTTHSEWVNLENLVLYNNNLSTLNTYSTWPLVELLVYNNNLTSITTYSSWVNLTSLMVDDNAITSLITYPQWTALTSLTATNTNITTIEAQREWTGDPYINFDISGCAVSSSTVINNIVIEIDNSSKTSGVVNLSGGTNAVPTGAGIIAVNSLIAKGIEVITNMVTTTAIPTTTLEPTYYVSSSLGDDDNDGSFAHPWASLDKVNSETFSPGDIIAFRRGDTFRGYIDKQENGSSGLYITYTAYGSGLKPMILGSENRSGMANWALYSTNIWRTSSIIANPGYENDIANLVFNADTSCGVKKTSLFDCTLQGEWYYDTADRRVYMYSTSNPGLYYTNIEVAGCYDSLGTFTWTFSSYINVNNLNFKYAGNGSIWMQSCAHFVIEECDFSWVGGWYYAGGYGRLGNAIQMWSTDYVNYINDIVIRRNLIDQCWDAGISPQGYGTSYTQTNIQMYYNIIKNCYYSYEIFTRAGATMSNINFYNNTCIDAGSQWSANQRTVSGSGNAEHLRNSEDGAIISNCNIKNNIFYGALNRGVHTDLNSGLDMDYNLYYDMPVVGQHDGSDYTTLAQWRAGSGYDVHSLWADPLLTSATDYHLTESSPCINAGVDLGLTLDYDGNTVGSSPDLGAYEYGSTAPVTTGIPTTTLATTTIATTAAPTTTVWPAEYYLSPTGSDATGDGSYANPWWTLNQVWTVIGAGDTVYMMGGTYNYIAKQVLHGVSGTAGNLINIWAYPDETPILTKNATGWSYPTGLIDFEGDYCHFKGLEITGNDQENDFIWTAFWANDSSHNIFEKLNCHHNGHGFRLQGISDANEFLRCDFHHNEDPLTTGDAYGNADGLEISYITPGLSNTVTDCRFWSNSDDGLDLTENESLVTIDGCWSWYNGYIPDTFTTGGNGMGYKLGRAKADATYHSTLLVTMTNCMGFSNRMHGLDQNYTDAIFHIYNNVFYGNGAVGIELGQVTGCAHIVRNNISYSNLYDTDFIAGSTVDHNSWQVGTVTDADFASISLSGVDGSRTPSGYLPTITFMHLVSGSDMINAGVDVGLPYASTAPDCGAFEYGLATTTEAPTTTSGATTTESPSTLLTDLLGYWKLDETSGTIANDSWGSNNGTINGTVGVVGRVGYAVDMTVATNSVYIPYNASLISTGSVMSIAVGTYLDSLPTTVGRGYYLYSQYDTTYGPAQRITVQLTDNRVAVGFMNTTGTSSYVFSSSALLTGTWYRIVAVCQGNGLEPKLYINGADVSTDGNNFNGTLRITNSYITWGNEYPGEDNAPDGRIDNVMIWDKALSVAEIAEDYNDFLNGIALL